MDVSASPVYCGCSVALVLAAVAVPVDRLVDTEISAINSMLEIPTARSARRYMCRASK